jgi:hypothetical protein
LLTFTPPELDVSGSQLAADECLALANARHLDTLDLSGTAVAASAASLEAVPFQPAEMASLLGVALQGLRNSLGERDAGRHQRPEGTIRFLFM